MENYKITVEVLGVETTKTGKTAFDALSKFEMGWEEIKSKGILIAEKGDKKVEKLMNAPTLRRIFNNKIAKQSWAKNIETLLS